MFIHYMLYWLQTVGRCRKSPWLHIQHGYRKLEILFTISQDNHKTVAIVFLDAGWFVFLIIRKENNQNEELTFKNKSWKENNTKERFENL